MRKCVKCGAEYADTDFRTLCGYCMGNVGAAAPAQAAPGAGPVQAGVSASEPARPAPIIPITITLPEITIPEIGLPNTAPWPEPRAPAPHHEPFEPPLTPQPNPEVPQPTIIPLPQPEREPAVPQPMPQPGPAPQPAPMPQPEPQPQPMPQPQPIPRPAPSEPAPGASVGRALRPDEMAASRSTLWLYLIVAGACGVICIILLNHPFAGFPIKQFFLILTGWLTYYFFRQALYRSAVSSTRLAPKGRLRLAEPLSLEAVIAVIREVGVSGIEITLTGEERAVKRSGDSSTTYRHSFYTKTARVNSPPKWPGGYEVRLAATLPLPGTAPPSFAGRKNSIIWSANLRVGLVGLPDVRLRVPLNVLPGRGEPPPPNAHLAYRLPELGPLNAEIGFTCPLSTEKLPIFEVGREVSFTLRLNPQGDFAQQRIFVELGYLISGSGDSENMTVASQSFPIWQGNPDRLEKGVLVVPPAVLVTYDGTHLRIRWAVTVRHEVPWGRDHRQVFEVKMAPAFEG